MVSRRTQAVPDAGYSLADVCRLVGLKPRQVIDWAEKRVVVPDLADTTGSGTPRLYSASNLIEFVLVRELVRLGVTVGRTAGFLDVVRAHEMGLWATVRAVRFGRDPSGAMRLT